MKTTLQSKTSKAAIKFVASVIPRRPSLPILSTIRCYANGCFDMLATDLDITLRARCPGTTTIEGTRLISARALQDACARESVFGIDAENDKFVIFRAGSGALRISESLAVAEFPPVPEIPATATQRTFPAVKFMAALRSVSSAMSTDSARYIINSVCIEFKPDGALAVATDGRRLHRSILSVETDSHFEAKLKSADAAMNTATAAHNSALESAAALESSCPPVYRLAQGLPRVFGARELYERIASPEVIAATDAVRQAGDVLQKARENLGAVRAGQRIVLPKKAVKAILAMPLVNVETITVSSWETSAAIVAGDFSVITKQVEGNYPDWCQCVPLDMLRTVQVDRVEFAAAVTQAASVETEKCFSVKLELSINKLVVSAKSELGEASADVPVNYQDRDVCIALCPDYLADICRAGDTASLCLEFIDERSPAKITTDDGFMAVIMPMKTS